MGLMRRVVFSVFLIVFIISAVSATITPTTNNPGTWTGPILHSGTYTEIYGVPGSPGSPGNQLSATSGDGQWSLTGLIGQGATLIAPNVYSTQYTGGTFTLISGLWGDALTLTGITATVIADYSTGTLHSTLTFSTLSYNGFTISVSSSATETSNDANGHTGTVDSSTLTIVDVQKPVIGTPTTVPQFPNCNYGTVNNPILVQVGITDNNAVNASRLNWKYQGTVYNYSMQPLGQYNNFWETLITLPITSIKDGSLVQYNIYATDNSGNEASTNYHNLFTYDCSPPITTLTVGTPQSINYITSATQLTLTPADTGSGVANTYYKIDGESFIGYTTPFSISGSDGSHTVYYYSVDKAGNVELTNSQTFILDNTAPSTTDNSASFSAWQASDITITLTPTDSGSGVASTTYCVDTTGTCTPSLTGTSVLVTCTAGTVCPQQYVRYYSTDKVGNIEAVKTSGKIRIDKQNPTTSLSVGTPKFDNFVTSSTQFSLSCDDGTGSGCQSTLYSTDGSTPSLSYSTPFSISGSDGSYTIKYYSIDNVGNNEVTNLQTFILDNTPPSTIDNSASFSAWQMNDVSITLTPSDSESGVASTDYCIDITGTCTPSTPGTSVTLTCAAGTVCPQQYVRYFSTDKLGNKESVETSGKIMIDKQSPVSAISSPAQGSLFNSDFSVILTDSDVGSGLATCQYKVLSNNIITQDWITRACNTPVTITVGPTGNCRDGGIDICDVQIRSIDAAGNTGTINDRTFSIDFIPPAVAIISNASTDGVFLFQFMANATDIGGSGVQIVNLSLSDSSGNVVFNNLAMNSDGVPGIYQSLVNLGSLVSGTYTLTVNAIDNAGNIGKTTQSFVILNNVAPSNILSVGSNTVPITGGTVNFQFYVTVRGSNKIKFGMDNIAGLTPTAFNATISSGNAFAYVGDSNFNGAGILTLTDLDPSTPNTQGVFTLSLTIPPSMIPGNYPINYYINFA